MGYENKMEKLILVRAEGSKVLVVRMSKLELSGIEVPGVGVLGF